MFASECKFDHHALMKMCHLWGDRMVAAQIKFDKIILGNPFIIFSGELADKETLPLMRDKLTMALSSLKRCVKKGALLVAKRSNRSLLKVSLFFSRNPSAL